MYRHVQKKNILKYTYINFYNTNRTAICVLYEYMCVCVLYGHVYTRIIIDIIHFIKRIVIIKCDIGIIGRYGSSSPTPIYIIVFMNVFILNIH